MERREGSEESTEGDHPLETKPKIRSEDTITRNDEIVAPEVKPMEDLDAISSPSDTDSASAALPARERKRQTVNIKTETGKMVKLKPTQFLAQKLMNKSTLGHITTSQITPLSTGSPKPAPGYEFRTNGDNPRNRYISSTGEKVSGSYQLFIDPHQRFDSGDYFIRKYPHKKPEEKKP